MTYLLRMSFFCCTFAAETNETMSELIHIDNDYRAWVENIKRRYKQSQIKAVLKANQELMAFYWQLGKDIVELHAEDRWGAKVLQNLSQDLRRDLPDVKGLSETSLGYIKRFYLLYSQLNTICPHVVGEFDLTPTDERNVTETRKISRKMSWRCADLQP